jgi:hypothetical protein
MIGTMQTSFGNLQITSEPHDLHDNTNNRVKTVYKI